MRYSTVCVACSLLIFQTHAYDKLRRLILNFSFIRYLLLAERKRVNLLRIDFSFTRCLLLAERKRVSLLTKRLTRANDRINKLTTSLRIRNQRYTVLLADTDEQKEELDRVRLELANQRRRKFMATRYPLGYEEL
jgi:hypothetical protein